MPSKEVVTFWLDMGASISLLARGVTRARPRRVAWRVNRRPVATMPGLRVRACDRSWRWWGHGRRTATRGDVASAVRPVRPTVGGPVDDLQARRHPGRHAR